MDRLAQLSCLTQVRIEFRLKKELVLKSFITLKSTFEFLHFFARCDTKQIPMDKFV